MHFGGQEVTWAYTWILCKYIYHVYNVNILVESIGSEHVLWIKNQVWNI